MLSASARRVRGGVAAVVALLAGGTLTGCGGEAVRGQLASPAAAVGSVLRERPCPDSDFTCVTLAVPADHFAPGSPNWAVTFALHRPRGQSRGVVVTATGGPGSSGIAVADDYLSNLPPEITDHYDVVFFDQRGIGRSRPFRCDRATADMDLATIDSSASRAARDAYAVRARTFAADCFAEAGVRPSDAPLYATTQAVEDLETFRHWLHADKLILYGESYGTQYQQAYAAAHPEHVAQLVLDGVVDQRTGVLQFLTESARAYSSVLTSTLAACDRDPVCAADAPGTSVAGYDALARGLAAVPRRYSYPTADGGTQPRTLTLADLRTAAAGSVSSPETRAQLQRAVNSALLGDDVPLGRLADAGDGVDPDSGERQSDGGFSEGLYYAVECQDFPFVVPSITGRARLDEWLGAAARAGIDRERLPDVFYTDLPCLFWPGAGARAPQPAVSTDPPYPELLLTANTDPNTPTVDAQRVLARTRNAALVSLTGGPHVIYGLGEPCVDDLVTGFLTSGRLPEKRVTVCDGELSDVYDPVAPRTAAGYRTAEDTVQIVLGALVDDPAFGSWSGGNTLTLGCTAGGTAEYEMNGAGTVRATLHDCAWTPHVPVNGTARVLDGGYGDATLSISLPFAKLTLSKDGLLHGEFRGRRVA